ncbi:MAG: globin [Verrucomicrobiota bacterium]
MITIDTLNQHVGEEKLRATVAAFYRRVREDALIGRLYPQDDWAGAEKRLADFIVYRFGGPQTYIEERGHPRLRMRHISFSIGVAERDQWLKLMGESMREAGISEEAAQVMIPFFAQVADMMRNRPE